MNFPKAALISLLFIVICLTVSTAGVKAISFNMTNLGDTFVDGNAPTDNFGTNTFMNGNYVGWYYFAYIKFNITQLKSVYVDSASLCTNETRMAVGAHGFVSNISSNQTWEELKVTYNTRPTAQSGITRVWQNNFLDCVDVTDFINNYIRSGFTNASFMFSTPGETNHGVTVYTKESQFKPFLNVTYNNSCYSPYGTTTPYSGGGLPGVWDLNHIGYCADDFGNTSDSCDTTSYYVVRKQTCGEANYCVEAKWTCEIGKQVCANGQCIDGLTLNFTSNKAGCALYSANYTSLGTSYQAVLYDGVSLWYPPNTTVTFAYSPISDCEFDFWYLSNGTKLYGESVSRLFGESLNLTAVWVGGSGVVIPEGGVNPQGGGVTSGNSFLDTFTSGWFILGLINIVIPTVAVYLSKSWRLGLGTFVLIALAFLFGGYYPSYIWIIVIIFASISVVSIVQKIWNR